MTDWMPIADWAAAETLDAPDVQFELRNAEGKSMFSWWQREVPQHPRTWASPPVEFRVVPCPEPQRSDPLPHGD